MADKEGLITQFTAITGVDVDRATFYLESANWNLDVSNLLKYLLNSIVYMHFMDVWNINNLTCV